MPKRDARNLLPFIDIATFNRYIFAEYLGIYDKLQYNSF